MKTYESKQMTPNRLTMEQAYDQAAKWMKEERGVDPAKISFTLFESLTKEYMTKRGLVIC